MPVSYRFDTASQTISVELKGCVTDQELLRAAEKLWSDPQYRPEYSRLIDLTRATSFRLSADLLRRLANRNLRDGVGRIALVAETSANYGMARMYEVYCDGLECQVFRKMSDALEWLREIQTPAVPAAQTSAFAS